MFARQQRILVVDDEPDCLFLLENMLTRAGYLVDKALGGDAALRKLGKERYDLVVVDSAPVLASSDALMLASWADATLIVVAHGRTERTALADALDLLLTAKATVIGVVIDKAASRGGSRAS